MVTYSDPCRICDRESPHELRVTNDCLRPLGFMRVLEPYAAFQELFMWLANQARPLKPIPKIDDRTMAEAKGFDKFSFRKPKREAQP
jgi:hypothetical protein